MFLFHEIHCDDFQLEVRRDRETYQASRTLLEALVGVAEARGLRLALRFRHPFAEAARAFEGADNPLRRWEERGHEIGTHAHRRRIRQTRDAIDACGVRQNHCVVPGLIQSRRPVAAWTLRSCRDLGFRYVTDQVQFGAFAYAGLTPWRPAPDLRGPGQGAFVFADVSVNPFAWGMLEHTPQGVRQVYGLRDVHFDALLGLLDQHLAGPRPHPVCYFGYPFHEHQHQRAEDDLRPDEESLLAWDRFLGLALERPVTPALPRTIVETWEQQEGTLPPTETSPMTRLVRAMDPRDLRQDGPSWLMEHWDPVSWAHRQVQRLRPTPAVPISPWLTEGEERTVHIEGRTLRAWRWGPGRPRAAIVVSVSGVHGGRRTGLTPMGLDPRQLGDDVAVWLWDRSPPHAPGASHHGTEAAAVFAMAAAEGVPTGWLTWSAGVLPPLLALDRTDPAFLVDVEAPADRRSLLRPQDLAPDTAERTLHETLGGETALPEPRRLIRALACPYHRVQADPDHVHGSNLLHAAVMLHAAPGTATLNGRHWDGTLEGLPGPIAQQGAAIRRVLRGALDPA